jgi:hypothetical protein
VTAGWPESIEPPALHGLAGEIVTLLAPHTEADPVALLIQLLVGVGSVLGPGPHFRVEADRHGTNLFAVLVGQSSKARKGTSWGYVKRLLGASDATWAHGRIQSGLSSGEGLIWAVRDAVPARGTSGKPGGGEEPADPGVDDKRLLIVEPEFASTLRVISRDGNTLSPLIRQAWDDGTLRSMTKNSPAVATGSHISLIGHITRDELERDLEHTETANGFANRFLWVCVKRARVLPDGGNLDSVDVAGVIRALGQAVEVGRSSPEMKRDSEAAEMWRATYPALSEGRPGLWGAVTSRAEAQTVRLALLYALLDRDSAIRRVHLEAALAVWNYCDASCRFIFGDSLGDPVADELLAALREAPEGLTRKQIRDLFSRHARPGSVERALRTLGGRGLVDYEQVRTGGRPAERWFATGGATDAT